MGVAVLVAGVAAAALAALALSMSARDARLWLPELATGLAWLIAAVAAPRGARGFALIAALVAATWWLGALVPAAVFWHRALVIHAVLAVPAVLPRRGLARMVVVAGYLASITVWPWEQPALAAVLSAAVLVAAAVGRSATAVVATSAILAAAFTAPVALAAIGVPRDASLAVSWGYALALVVTAVLCAGVARTRTPHAMTDLVVELGPVPRDELDRALGAGRHDPSLRSDLAAAVAAAESLVAQHARLQSELTRTRDDVSESHRRLLSAETDARTTLQSELETGSMALIRRLLDRLAADADASTDGVHATRAAEHLSVALDDVTALAQGLTPPALGRGLGAALEGLADAAPLPVAVVLPDVRLPSDIETCVFLVAAEALSNVGKHARASSASVQLTADAARVRLEIADDGVGGADASAGHGISGICARAATMGGRATAVSPTGRGTTITVTLPLRGSLAPEPGERLTEAAS